MLNLLQYLAAIVMLSGALFGLLAAIGLLRLPDLYTRLHAASKAGLAGAGLILLAVALAAGDAAIIFRAVAGILFLVLTTPVSAHLLARSAYSAGFRPHPSTRANELETRADNIPLV
jgi:multicomponent Na+:H+ antiporter subunit G